MNILITSVSRKVSLVKSFKDALAREGGGKVIAVDVTAYASGLYIADEHYLVPLSIEPMFIDTMLDLCKTCRVDLLIPTRDEELPLFAEYKDKFQALGTTVMVSGLQSIQICCDKKLFQEFCRDHGFVTPRCFEDPSLIGDDDFPLFVKPRFGKGGAGSGRIDTREELESSLRKEPDIIVQTYIHSREYTVDTFCDFSGTVISVVPRERLWVWAGESFTGKTYKNVAIMAETARLATKLDLIGHNTIQCFFDGEDVRFIEVNPRFGGGAALGFAAGAPTPLFLVQVMKGRTLAPCIGEFKDNLLMLRYTDDLFLDADSLVARKF